MNHIWYVYIMADHPGGLLYIGITNNLLRRVEEHKNGACNGFTKRYWMHHLVYYEIYSTPYDAIKREKQLKHWNRAWKIRLVKTENPFRKDLSEEF
jgi:putative endonuclease